MARSLRVAAALFAALRGALCRAGAAEVEEVVAGLDDEACPSAGEGEAGPEGPAPCGGLSLRQLRAAARPARHPKEVPPQANDEIYGWLQATVPGQWGDVIDAGTGPSSLTWLAGCPVSTLTAVTANETAAHNVRTLVGRFLDPSLDKVVAGHWQDPEFMKDATYDVVVADWLLGSVDYFAPHYQVALMRRLYKLVRPGGWLLFTGKEPDDLKANGTVPDIMLDIDNLRDAATVLTRHFAYREIPQWWIQDELKTNGFSIHEEKVAPMPLQREYVSGQLDWAASQVSKIQDQGLRTAFEKRVADLRQRVDTASGLDGEGYVFGQVYALVAQRPRATAGFSG